MSFLNNDLDFFLESIRFNIRGEREKDWIVNSIGTGFYNGDWYWVIILTHKETMQERIIKIPCYRE